MPRWLGCWLVTTAAVVGLPGALRGQADFCDPGLSPSSQSANHYRNYPEDQPDRCEGRYVQTRGGGLRIASLTAVFDDYPRGFVGSLQIRWQAPPGTRGVHLRAQGFGRQFYRMDTEVRQASSFDWRSDLLVSSEVDPNDLGILGWTMLAGDAERPVYLPLRISRQPRPALPDGYKLLIEPSRQLDEIFLTVATTDADGEPDRFLDEDRPLGHGYYPVGRRVEVEIPKPPDTGIYFVRVSGQHRLGDAVHELRFYHEEP